MSLNCGAHFKNSNKHLFRQFLRLKPRQAGVFMIITRHPMSLCVRSCLSEWIFLLLLVGNEAFVLSSEQDKRQGMNWDETTRRTSTTTMMKKKLFGFTSVCSFINFMKKEFNLCFFFVPTTIKMLHMPENSNPCNRWYENRLPIHRMILGLNFNLVLRFW